MDLEKIEGLVRIMEGSSLKTMKLRDGEFEISMSKLDNAPVLASPGLPAFPGYSGAGSATAEGKESAAAGEEQEDLEFHITSPIVGTFYSAAGPDIPAYVKVGDRVRAGDTVCIVEAMKMMNEITADYDCEIEAVLVSNEQKVEYGQPLFRVKKL
ncbi:acetyl-CoA carboxylase biotin carboxyl carrier protein [Oribacterium sp. oral taxon 102]|uniref:acetyl-CoA carboxylase biotin carboxyl carrier protein n=1 Tax=Oribacterium sp. oral taxon 102 TaxID=671214 RepID=UPI0015BAB05C|nr:acetyl-CoA carboxylase biotin carboxyl carrier protein [Oribacterium sp. oral taxon 102]NWO21980.1 acetyl-CoA carboxylase biotin carboxyl carrier protein [Oribacterium sp. oral taxon 102]